MAVYLVRPRRSNVQDLSLRNRSLSRSRRPTQIDEVRSLRKGDRAIKELRKAVQDHNGTLLRKANQSPVTGVEFVEMTKQQADRLRREQPHLVVLRDQAINVIDPILTAAAIRQSVRVSDLWHLPAIGLDSAKRKKLGLTGKGVTVAVLDTGIQADHPELDGGCIVGSVKFDVKKWKTVQEEKCTDTSGHGTHVAGLICGKRVGIAPGASVWNAMMIPHGHGMLSDFVLALEWAGQTPEVQIVNISAGIPGYVDGMQDVLGDLLMAGVLPIVAVGNEGRDKTRSPGNYVEVLSVGASNNAGHVASWSGGGKLKPAAQIYTVPNLVAPGENIWSCVMSGGYEAWSGTSMATPIVSGVAALVLEKYQNTDLTVTDLREMLLEACKDLSQHSDRQGCGAITVPKQAFPNAKAKKSPRKKAPI